MFLVIVEMDKIYNREKLLFLFALSPSEGISFRSKPACIYSNALESPTRSPVQPKLSKSSRAQDHLDPLPSDQFHLNALHALFRAPTLESKPRWVSPPRSYLASPYREGSLHGRDDRASDERIRRASREAFDVIVHYDVCD
jgi:hypothetical protein